MTTPDSEQVLAASITASRPATTELAALTDPRNADKIIVYTSPCLGDVSPIRATELAFRLAGSGRAPE